VFNYQLLFRLVLVILSVYCIKRKLNKKDRDATLGGGERASLRRGAGVTGSERNRPIGIKYTLKDRPVLRRPIRCQHRVEREGPIQFRALGRTTPKSEVGTIIKH
jgi:hypothetical protein